MRARVFRLLPLLLLFWLTVSGLRVIYENNSQSISITALPLDPDNPDRRKVGRLEFLDAWELRSDNPDFGGISALARLPDGRFLAVSDAGTLIGFGLTGKKQADHPFIAPMPDAHARGRNYEDRDSESLVHDPASGRFWVGYEAKAAVRRFDPAFARREAIARPAAMQKWGFNSGAEAMLRLPDGRFVIFSEGHDDGWSGGTYEALMFSGDPTEQGSSSFAFGYRPPEGFKITDAALLPDGRILTLNRRIAFPNGFSAALGIIDTARIRRGETIAAKEIARLQSPLLVDNMEGLVVEENGGKTIVWMISDNNFNLWQRTILMKFSLRETHKKKPGKRKAPGFDAI